MPQDERIVACIPCWITVRGEVSNHERKDFMVRGEILTTWLANVSTQMAPLISGAGVVRSSTPLAQLPFRT